MAKYRASTVKTAYAVHTGASLFCSVLFHLPCRSRLDTPSGPAHVNELQQLFYWTQLSVEKVAFNTKRFDSFWVELKAQILALPKLLHH